MELITRMRSRLQGVALLVIFLSFSGGIVSPLYAQETRLEALVEFIAGQNIYFNVGTSDGITTNDSLVAYRGNRRLGLLQIIGVTTSRTVTTFAEAPFAVTRGDVITLEVLAGEQPDDTVAETPTDPVDTTPERRSVFEGGRTGAQLPPVDEGIRISGRLALSMDLTSVTTEGLQSDFERTRNYQIPTVSLRASVEELPANLRININSRFAHRGNDSRLGIPPTNSLRVYQLNVEHANPGSPFQARLGRFFNPVESFSGFWDGVGFSYMPTEGFGAGVLGGFQPERGNEHFVTDLPKYSAFGAYAYRSDDGSQRYNASVSFHQVLPDDDVLSTHTFVGVNHSFHSRGFRLRNLFQIDQDPVTDSWELTRLQVYSMIPVSRSISLRGRYLMRKPYNLFLPENTIGYRRERVSGGFALRAFSGTFSADVSVNTSEISERSYTYSGFASVPRLGALDLGFTAMVNYWRRDDDADVIYITPSISRNFGSLLTQLQYHFQQSNFDVIESTNHTMELAFNLPLGNRIRSSIRLQSRWGESTSMFRVYTTLWTRL